MTLSANCAYLELWHNDIREFLELKRNTGDEHRRTHDMNNACWVPDLFIERVEAREDWTLFRSHEVADLHETYGEEFRRRYVEYERRAEAGEILGETIRRLICGRRCCRCCSKPGTPGSRSGTPAMSAAPRITSG